jgi:hypothetical protein
MATSPKKRLCIALLCVVAGWAPAADCATLPYRFLLVIGNQWKDPASRLIEAGGEFPVVVTLLKTWGLPFDILRLDQQRFDRYYLMDREGRPRYGTILWDADAHAGESRDLALLSALVNDHGVALVVLGDAVANPQVAALAGLEYAGEHRFADGLAFSDGHFITRGLAGREKELTESMVSGSRVSTKEATAIVSRGQMPFVTIRVVPGGGRVVWLDAHRASVRIGTQILRDLFKRSLVWAQGYALYAEYPKSILLFMDDFGTSDRSYLPYWHYRTLNEDDIRKGIIDPLQRHQAVLMMDVVTGYVDRKARRVVSPWKQQVIDELDGKTFHDYVSAKRGLDAGQREGVLEIQSHGYTHMLPDLESPPGPFWTVPMDGNVPHGFDEEFGDNLRKKDVPAITQRFLMERGLEYLRADFGVVPLFVINGGGGKSLSYPHHSARLAAEMGFGLGHFNAAWCLGKDLALAMEQVVHSGSWAHDRSLAAGDIAWTIDAPQFLIFHDRDVSLDVTAVDRLLTSLGPGIRYMTANEYCGYLHARAERDAQDPGAIVLHYDEHYCRYFADHPSTWVLHLSDDTRRDLKTPAPEKRAVKIAKGTGRHVVRFAE